MADLRLCSVCNVPWCVSRKMCCRKSLIRTSWMLVKKQSALEMESVSMAAALLPGGDDL